MGLFGGKKLLRSSRETSISSASTSYTGMPSTPGQHSFSSRSSSVSAPWEHSSSSSSSSNNNSWFGNRNDTLLRNTPTTTRVRGSANDALGLGIESLQRLCEVEHVVVEKRLPPPPLVLQESSKALHGTVAVQSSSTPTGSPVWSWGSEWPGQRSSTSATAITASPFHEPIEHRTDDSFSSSDTTSQRKRSIALAVPNSETFFQRAGRMLKFSASSGALSQEVRDAEPAAPPPQLPHMLQNNISTQSLAPQPRPSRTRGIMAKGRRAVSRGGPPPSSPDISHVHPPPSAAAKNPSRQRGSSLSVTPMSSSFDTSTSSKISVAARQPTPRAALPELPSSTDERLRSSRWPPKAGRCMTSKLKRPSTADASSCRSPTASTFGNVGRFERPSTADPSPLMQHDFNSPLPSSPLASGLTLAVARLGPPPTGLPGHSYAERVELICTFARGDDDSTAKSRLLKKKDRIAPRGPGSVEDDLVLLENAMQQDVTLHLGRRGGAKQAIEELRLASAFVESRGKLGLDTSVSRFRVFADQPKLFDPMAGLTLAHAAPPLTLAHDVVTPITAAAPGEALPSLHAVALSPAPRRRRRPRTAPEGDIRSSSARSGASLPLIGGSPPARRDDLPQLGRAPSRSSNGRQSVEIMPRVAPTAAEQRKRSPKQCDRAQLYSNSSTPCSAPPQGVFALSAFSSRTVSSGSLSSSSLSQVRAASSAWVPTLSPRSALPVDGGGGTEVDSTAHSSNSKHSMLSDSSASLLNPTRPSEDTMRTKDSALRASEDEQRSSPAIYGHATTSAMHVLHGALSFDKEITGDTAIGTSLA